MSTINTAITKRPFKFIEVPLNKFQDEAIPHHQEIFLKHKSNVYKLNNICDYVQLDREMRDKKRIVRQLMDLMYELDTLRTQVEDYDLDKFDGKTVSLRKIILELIGGYTGLEAETKRSIEDCSIVKNQTYVQSAPQIQIEDDIEALILQEKESRFKQIEALNNDIVDVHGIFVDLNKMVSVQQEHVDNIESNCEVAENNVKSGLTQLIKASRFKKASYPVAGAFIGTIVGGPIGAIAGLKVGGLAAIGCGLVGYFGGRIFKKANDAEILETEVELTTGNCDNYASKNSAVNSASDKKDI